MFGTVDLLEQSDGTNGRSPLKTTSATSPLNDLNFYLVHSQIGFEKNQQIDKRRNHMIRALVIIQRRFSGPLRQVIPPVEVLV